MTGDRPLGDRTDRYVRGELSPAEGRELAQASLDSPELFEELTDSALARAALYAGTLPSGKIIRFPARTRLVIAAVAAVAAAVLISLAVVRPWRTETPHPRPVLATNGQGQPVLLASGLQPAPTDPDRAPVFRGAETDSRAPQTVGSIVSIEDGLTAIDIGFLDGLDKGTELRVFRDDSSPEAIGRLQVTTVFRERARGRIVDGQKVRVKDRVRVDDTAHLEALLGQVDALYRRGEADAAYQAAERASRWAETANAAPVPQAAFWNQLAVLRILRGDYQDAEAALTRATAASPRSGLAYAQSMNNLGVLAELRGERRTAKSRYSDALQAFAGIPNPPEQDRRAAEFNLTRLRGSH